MATKASRIALAASNISSTGEVTADLLDSIDSVGFVVLNGDGDINLNGAGIFSEYIKLGSYTETQRNSITPSPGMVVYNSTAGVLQQYVKDNIWASIAPSAGIVTVTYPNSQTAATTGDVITVNGVGFDLGAIVSFLKDGVSTDAASTTRITSAQVTAVLPSLPEGTYSVTVTNGTGVAATLPAALDVDGLAVFNTASGSLGTFVDRITLSSALNVGAVEDGVAISITITSGALPTGLSMTSVGIITGTPNTGVFASTAYAFTVTATDAENQIATRSYSITILDNYQAGGSSAFNS